MAETVAENARIAIFTDKLKVLDEQLGNVNAQIGAFETEKKALEESLKMNEEIKGE